MKQLILFFLTIMLGNALAQEFYYPFDFESAAKYTINVVKTGKTTENNETTTDTALQNLLLRVDLSADTAYLISYKTIHPLYSAYLYYYPALENFKPEKNLTFQFYIHKKTRKISIKDAKATSAAAQQLTDTLERYIIAEHPELIESIRRNNQPIVADFSMPKINATLTEKVLFLLSYLQLKKTDGDTLSSKILQQNPIEKTEKASCITKMYTDKLTNNFIRLEYYNFTDFQKKAVAFITAQAQKYKQEERLKSEPWILKSISFSKETKTTFAIGQSTNFPEIIRVEDYQYSGMPNDIRTTTSTTIYSFKKEQ